MAKTKLLSNKERKRYSRLIGEKLKTLGMSDETVYVPFRKKNNEPIVRKYVDSNGKVIFEGNVGKLSNAYRNLIKRLRKLPKEAVDTFLNSTFTQAKD